MRSAIVFDGIVINIIVGEIEGSIPCPSETGIGWAYDGEGFSPPPKEAYVPTNLDVNAERNRRIDGGMMFDEDLFQTDGEARDNVSGAATDAVAAQMEGAEPGDLHWHGEEDPFCWIATDNSLHPMDAFKVVEFSRAMREHKRKHIFAALALKGINPIPTDYTDDKYWP